MGILGMGSAMLRAGTMQNYLKTSAMTMKWEEKKQNLTKKKGEERELTPKEREIENLQRDMAHIREGNQIGQLDIKLKSGGELTDEELEYLKTKNPELYNKAIEIKRERAAYKKQLENCKTKEDVEELRANKLQRFTSEIKSIKSNPNIGEGKKLELIEQIGRRFMGIMNEHNKFVGTTKYKELPSEQDERAGRKKKTQLSSDTETLEQELRLLLAGASAPADITAAKPAETAEVATLDIKA